MTTVLEINDLQISVMDSAGKLSYQEPAAIAWQEGNFLFGDAAMKVSRSQPQQFNQRYLSTLSSQPLPAAIGPALNHADLAYQHLKSLGLENQSILASVPSHWTNEQLGLLLGICNELQIQITGFADSALSQLLGATTAIDIGLLDVELHRLTLTQCRQTNGSLVVGDHRVWEGRGYLHILEGWMSLVADEYVQRTRFDPLHSGESEQQLLDQLRQWISGSSGTSSHSFRASIERNGDPHEIEVQPPLLIEKLNQRLHGIELPGQVALTARAHTMPGLTDWVAAQTQSMTRLPQQQDLSNNYQYLSSKLPSGSITRLSEVPSLATTETVSEAAEKATPDASATHLLREYHAQPLSAFGFQVTELGVQRNLPWQHNGAPTQSNPVILNAGDEVVIDGSTFVAIRIT